MWKNEVARIACNGKKMFGKKIKEKCKVAQNCLSHNIQDFQKIIILHHFTQFRRVQMFGPLPSLLAFRLTKFPQNMEGYKKVKLHNRDDNKKLCKDIYPCLVHVQAPKEINSLIQNLFNHVQYCKAFSSLVQHCTTVYATLRDQGSNYLPQCTVSK